jgi:protein-tyrosine phosphatase
MQMATEVIQLDPSRPDPRAVKRAAAAVEAGRLVAFPTETVYGLACRAERRAVEALDTVKHRPAAKPYSLHIADPAGLRRYVPEPGLKSRRLVACSWPGPLTIIFKLTPKETGDCRRLLGDDLFDLVYADSTIGVRCPDQPVATALLRQAECPVVAPSANRAGDPAPVDAQEVLAGLDGRIDLLLDAGRCRYARPSTVVKAGPGHLEIIRPGVLSRDKLEQLGCVRVLFVCSGNTCRSPMAAVLWQKAVAQKLGCGLDALEDRGYKARSAGISASEGLPAAAEAVAACAANGLDISAHRSRRVDERLLAESDAVFAMTAEHLARIVEMGAAGDKCFLLADGTGIADPIGKTQAAYSDCAAAIACAVSKRVDELVR